MAKKYLTINIVPAIIMFALGALSVLCFQPSERNVESYEIGYHTITVNTAYDVNLLERGQWDIKVKEVK